MKIFIIMCHDGIEETNIYAIYKYQEKAINEAKAMNDKEILNTSKRIKYNYYVDEWDVLA